MAAASLPPISEGRTKWSAANVVAKPAPRMTIAATVLPAASTAPAASTMASRRGERNHRRDGGEGPEQDRVRHASEEIDDAEHDTLAEPD